MGIIRAGETNLIPQPDEVLQAGDTLLVKGKQSDLQLVEGLQNLEVESQSVPDISQLESEEIGLVEAVLSPHSGIAGKNLRELNFRFKYGLSVLAVWRGGRAGENSAGFIGHGCGADSGYFWLAADCDYCCVGCGAHDPHWLLDHGRSLSCNRMEGGFPDRGYAAIRNCHGEYWGSPILGRRLDRSYRRDGAGCGHGRIFPAGISGIPIHA
jgi:hypothetical protein